MPCSKKKKNLQPISRATQSILAIHFPFTRLPFSISCSMIQHKFICETGRLLFPLIFIPSACLSEKKKRNIACKTYRIEANVKKASLNLLAFSPLFTYYSNNETLTINECCFIVVSQVYHVNEGREKAAKFFDEDLEDHQPFPTLQGALTELEQHVGCNIEIKWTMQLKVLFIINFHCQCVHKNCKLKASVIEKTYLFTFKILQFSRYCIIGMLNK